MKKDTLLLQCLAALLVANSHLETFYPFPWLAGDGLLGISIFFLISSFKLTGSLQSHPQPFSHYYLRRILRIYPSLYLTMVIFYVIPNHVWTSWAAIDYYRCFIFPTHFEFVTKIMIFYIVLFYSLKIPNPKISTWILLILTCCYVPLYIIAVTHVPSHTILRLANLSPKIQFVFCLLTFFFGSWLYNYYKDRENRPEPLISKDLICFIISFSIYFIFKILMTRSIPWSRHLYLLHIMVFPILFYLFRLCSSLRITEMWQSQKWLAFIIALVGSLTLEIYIVHYYVARFPWIHKLVFPINILVFFPLSILLSKLIEIPSTRFRQFVEKKLPSKSS